MERANVIFFDLLLTLLVAFLLLSAGAPTRQVPSELTIIHFHADPNPGACIISLPHVVALNAFAQLADSRGAGTHIVALPNGYAFRLPQSDSQISLALFARDMVTRADVSSGNQCPELNWNVAIMHRGSIQTLYLDASNDYFAEVPL